MFNPDYKEMLSLLIDEGVDFLIVGAYALAAHGYPRSTGDIDIWISPTLGNAQAAWRALARFGAPVAKVTAQDLAQEGVVLQIGVAPCRIDILTSIDGVSFQEAQRGRMMRVIEGVQIPFLGRDHLIRNKLSIGRLKDRADVEELGG